MIRKFFIPWLPLLLILFPVLSFADSPFKLASHDMSAYILEIFYGNVGDLLKGDNAVLAKMFGVFNSAILILATIVVIYILVISTVNTANDGEMLGKKWSSMWTPIKVVVGIILLIPKASGYSLIQVLVMYIVLMGVGMADKMWGAMVTHFALNGPLINNLWDDQTPSDIQEANINLAGEILKAEVCVAALEQKLRSYAHVSQDDTTAFPNLLNSIYTANATLDQAQVYYELPVPGHVPGMEDIKGKCGTIKWGNYTEASLCVGESPTSCKTKLNNPAIKKALQQNATLQIYNKTAIQQLIDNIKPIATKIAANKDYIIYNLDFSKITATNIGKLKFERPDKDSDLKYAGKVYNNYMNQFYRQFNYDGGARYNNLGERFYNSKDEIISYGWLVAGAYANSLLLGSSISIPKNPFSRFRPFYNNMEGRIESSKPLKSILNEKDVKEVNYLAFGSPITSFVVNNRAFASDTSQPTKRTPVPSISNLLSKELHDLVNDKIIPMVYANVSMVQWLGLRSILYSLIDVAQQAIEPIGTALEGIISSFLEMVSLTKVNTNVLNQMASLGQIFLTAGIVIWGVYGGIGTIATFITGAIITTGFWGAIALGAIIIGTLIIPFITILISTGAMIGYYIPFLPLVIFTFGIIGWLVGVFESMIAAPIVAIGIMLPEGQENFMGKASPAVMFLLNLFLRPTLMLFGLVGGLIMATLGIWIFLFLFAMAILILCGVSFGDIASILNGQVDFATFMASSVLPSIFNIIYIIGGFLVFPIIIMTTVVTICKKSFALIHTVPDNILRWLAGGMNSALGSEMASGGQEVTEQSRHSMGTLAGRGQSTSDSGQAKGGAERTEQIKENKRKKAEEALKKEQDKGGSINIS